MPRPSADYLPVMIEKLVAMLANDYIHAAHLMGCHPATVAKAMQHQATTQKQEEAAHRAIQQLEEEASRNAAQLAARHAAENIDSVETGTAPKAIGADLRESLQDTRKQAIDFVSVPQPVSETTMLVTVPFEKLEAFMAASQFLGVRQMTL